jgi:formamidopyrimidine-DNA glycosylase
MPELPEVEVLRRSLEAPLLGRRIARVVVRNGSLREPVRVAALRRLVVGSRIVAADRRAKYLLLHLDSEQSLVVNLGMSGRLTLVPATAPFEAHEHVAFYLDSGERLRFRDPRRFGLVLALPTATLATDSHFAHLGPEPLAGDFSGAYLARVAAGRAASVKSFLMDARVVVGVGNIYAAEALHRAGIHPARAAGRLSRARYDGLATAVRAVLREAIRRGGTTLNDFADGAGEPGYFQIALRVYDRAGEACRRCRGTIRRAVQGGRSSYYCPGCQR